MAMSQALHFHRPNNLARTHCLVITLHPDPSSSDGDHKPNFTIVEVATHLTLTFRMRFPVEGGQRSEFDCTVRDMMEVGGNYFGALGILVFERPGSNSVFMALVPGIFNRRDRWPVIEDWLHILL